MPEELALAETSNAVNLNVTIQNAEALRHGKYHPQSNAAAI